MQTKGGQKNSLIFSLIIVFVIVVLGLFTFSGVIRYTRGAMLHLFGERAFALASFTMTEIDRTVRDRKLQVNILATRLSGEEVLLQSNEPTPIDEVPINIDEIDTAWRNNEPLAFPIQDEILNNTLSKKLRSEFGEPAITSDGTQYIPFTEIFLTNTAGTNVAQTNQTSDFYQADEDWWIQAKANGSHIEDISYDESAGTYSINLASAIHDEEENFLGVVKVVWNVTELINTIRSTEAEQIHKHIFGTTTHLTLITEEGDVIYSTNQDHEFLEQANQTLLANSETLRKSGELYILVEDEESGITRLVTRAESTGFGEFAGLNWILIYEQDTSEILAPLQSVQVFVGLILGIYILAILYLAVIYNKHLEDVQELKNQFISIAAHELKTPLTSANWSIESIIDEKVPTKIQKPIETLQDSISHMNKLVEDLLNMSRLESGRLEIHPEKTNIIKLINETIATFETQIQTKKQNIIVKTPKRLSATIDPAILQLIVKNLISNAIKYSPKQSTITVTLGTSAGKIAFSVEDQGIGIPTDQQKSIFSKFFRAKNAEGTASGTGLGLFVIQRIIKGLGGEITFTSEENKGTIFTITLPKDSVKKKKIKA